MAFHRNRKHFQRIEERKKKYHRFHPDRLDRFDRVSKGPAKSSRNQRILAKKNKEFGSSRFNQSIRNQLSTQNGRNLRIRGLQRNTSLYERNDEFDDDLLQPGITVYDYDDGS